MPAAAIRRIPAARGAREISCNPFCSAPPLKWRAIMSRALRALDARWFKFFDEMDFDEMDEDELATAF
jgi:hypothetical protein